MSQPFNDIIVSGILVMLLDTNRTQHIDRTDPLQTKLSVDK